jgi:hypothetical protein
MNDTPQAILDKIEQINKESMFAMYEKKKGEQLELFQDQNEEFIDINEAEEILRSLQKDDPNEFERISELRDGIRSAYARMSNEETYVFCQAGRYQQVLPMDKEGVTNSRDIPTVLSRIKSSKKEPASILPKGHNQKIMGGKKGFSWKKCGNARQAKNMGII